MAAQGLQPVSGGNWASSPQNPADDDASPTPASTGRSGAITSRASWPISFTGTWWHGTWCGEGRDVTVTPFGLRVLMSMLEREGCSAVVGRGGPPCAHYISTWFVVVPGKENPSFTTLYSSHKILRHSKENQCSTRSFVAILAKPE